MNSILPVENTGSGGLRVSDDNDPGVNRPAFGPESTSQAIRDLHYCNVRYAQAKLLAHHVTLGMHGDVVGQKCSERVFGGLAFNLDILDSIHIDLDRYTKAVQNECHYKETSNTQPGQEVVQLMATEILRLKPLGAKIPGISNEPAVPDIQKEVVQLYRQSPKSITVQGWLENQQKYHRSTEERRDRLFARLVMAFFGGFALIVPMLIMTLHHTRLTALLTTSLCVIVVAVALAVYMENAEPKDVMAAVAAYAAVLVVFVGAGSGTGTS